jgi:hypothetical protein
MFVSGRRGRKHQKLSCNILAVEPTPRAHASSAVNVVQAQANQTDLSQWPWPQILVYGVLLGLFVFGGPGAQLIGLIRNIFEKTIGALVGWLVFLPPALTGEESDTKITLIKGSDATATLHVALFAAGAGVLSILSTSGLPIFADGAKVLVAGAVVLILAGVLLELTCLLRDYGYTMHSSNLTAIGARKSRLVKIASLCYIAGVFLLLVNAWWAQSHQSSVPAGWRPAPGASAVPTD